MAVAQIIVDANGGGGGGTLETITISNVTPTYEIPTSNRFLFYGATLQRGSVSSNPPTIQLFYGDGTTPASNAVTLTTSSTNYSFAPVDVNDFDTSGKLILKINSGNSATISGTIKVIKA